MKCKLLETVALATFPALLFLPVGVVFASDGRLDAARVPWILLVTQVLLACWVSVLAWRWKPGRAAIGLSLGPGERRHVLIGLIAGAILAASYELALGPALDWLRANVGDLIPPGETRHALGAAVVPFVIANVFVAPFVEEVLFRGLLDWRFRTLWGPRASMVIGVLAFGLLHWVGGIFYIAATALIGAGFLAYRRRTGSVFASIAAHFSFNTLEVLLSVSSATLGG